MFATRITSPSTCLRYILHATRLLSGSLRHGASATTKYDHYLTTADALLSEENRQRCMSCMLKTPPVGLKMKKRPVEDSSAAVLIALCRDPRTNEVSILFTRRSGLLSRHVRQISFPGGIKDPHDADYFDCALRETEEEIGLPRSAVELWGTGSMITPPSTAAIMPVVGVVNNFNMQELRINKDEVDEAFVIPIKRLANPAAVHYTQFKSGYSAPVFLVDNYRVWGITGFLTYNFLNCLIPQNSSKLRSRVKFIKPVKLGP